MTGEQQIADETRARPRRRAVAWIVAAVIVVLLAVGVVLADVSLRSYAEDRAEAEIVSSLPQNIEGDVDVSIGGLSFLQQYLTGSFDRVRVDAPALSVDGVPVEAHVVATGVPTDLSAPVERLTADITLSQDAVNSVVEIPGAATLTLDDGSVGYDGSISFLGLSLDYLVTAGVSVISDSVVLSPQTATLAVGSTEFDASDALDAVLDESIPLCVANYLPKGVQLTNLTTSAGSATVTLRANDFTIDEANLRSFGTCP